MSESYKDLKNLIHNELKIGKDEIREMIRESIAVEVRRIVDSKEQYIDQLVTAHIRRLVERGISDNGNYFYSFKNRVTQELSDEVARFIKQQLDISVKVKETGEEVK